MSDTISRQGVIDILCRECGNECTEWECKEVKSIREMPSANVPDTNVGEWIPCSERLPKRKTKEQMRGWYLTTNDYGSVMVTKYEFESESFGYVGWNSDTRIVAWRPLPEPWRGADDEEST